MKRFASAAVLVLCAAAVSAQSTTIWDLGELTLEQAAARGLEEFDLVITNTCCKGEVPSFLAKYNPDDLWIYFPAPYGIINPGESKTFRGSIDFSRFRRPGDYSTTVTVVCQGCDPPCEFFIEIKLRIVAPSTEPPESPGSTPDEIDPTASFCGPEIGPALQDAIQRIYDRALELPSSEIGAWDGVWFLDRNGSGIDIRVTKLINSRDQPVCPTQNCTLPDGQFTVMLCGNCIAEHIGNDILYGVMATMLRLPYLSRRAGAYYAEYASYGGVDPPSSQSAYAVGTNIVNAIADGRVSLGDICSLLNSTTHPTVVAVSNVGIVMQDQRAIDLMTEEVGDLKNCLACPYTAPPNVYKDYSRSNWSLSDGTYQDQHGRRVNARGEPVD